MCSLRQNEELVERSASLHDPLANIIFHVKSFGAEMLTSGKIKDNMDNLSTVRAFSTVSASYTRL